MIDSGAATAASTVEGYPSGATGIERRRAVRHPLRLAVIAVAIEGDRRPVHGHTVDLCRDGLRVVTDAELCRGHDQLIFLEMPGQAVAVDAEIVWGEQRGEQWVYGLALLAIEDDDRERLAALVA